MSVNGYEFISSLCFICGFFVEQDLQVIQQVIQITCQVQWIENIRSVMANLLFSLCLKIHQMKIKDYAQVIQPVLDKYQQESVVDSDDFEFHQRITIYQNSINNISEIKVDNLFDTQSFKKSVDQTQLQCLEKYKDLLSQPIQIPQEELGEDLQSLQLSLDNQIQKSKNKELTAEERKQLKEARKKQQENDPFYLGAKPEKPATLNFDMYSNLFNSSEQVEESKVPKYQGNSYNIDRSQANETFQIILMLIILHQLLFLNQAILSFILLLTSKLLASNSGSQQQIQQLKWQQVLANK